MTAFDLDFAVAPEKCIAGLGRHLRKNKYTERMIRAEYDAEQHIQNQNGAYTAD